ncbi:sulfurtransferase [Thetidibacter halocola]|uniref:Sulfurtransferase n=1 Tax=Thetidibacter halocola TaxID=2827239 RepID=A0A8J7WF19_9RHOB|nr:rhodanese-like domain-containing protein [Thetidibacter halocola]MBS0124521.1 sulfurtransferase [Thetidibacter halocola]
MKMLFKLSVAVAALASASMALAADPLVDVAWVKANLDNDEVVFVDVRPMPAYLSGHIPGAVHTDYGGPKDAWRVRVGDVRGLVRTPEDIAAHLGAIGVSNDDHVVVVPAGESSADMGAATRVYWTLNYLGHDEVSILDGGMAAYLKELGADKKPVNPLEEGAAQVEAAQFAAAPRPDMLISAKEVAARIADGAVAVDNRSADFYLGISKSGAAKVAGTVPGALNLPHSWTTVNAGGTFRDPDSLVKLFGAAGVPTSGPQISFCNTGQLASIGWFVSHELLGNDEAMIFDGSMAEWTHSGMETERKVEF